MNVTKRRSKIKPIPTNNFVPTPVRWYGEDGVRHGLAVKSGRKYVHLILMENPICIRKVNAEKEGHYIQPIPLCSRRGSTGQVSKDVKRLKRQLKRAAKAWHNDLSKEAANALKV